MPHSWLPNSTHFVWPRFVTNVWCFCYFICIANFVTHHFRKQSDYTLDCQLYENIHWNVCKISVSYRVLHSHKRSCAYMFSFSSVFILMSFKLSNSKGKSHLEIKLWISEIFDMAWHVITKCFPSFKDICQHWLLYICTNVVTVHLWFMHWSTLVIELLSGYKHIHKRVRE